MQISRKIEATPLVWLKGDEMTRYIMEMVHAKWITPFVDTSRWQYYDLGIKNRDATNDEVLYEAVKAGKEVCAIFKDATITPSGDQVKEMGLSRAFGSPNKVIRQEWQGISISRDTVALPGVPLGYKKPVLFDRYPQGGLYNSSFYFATKPGKVVTTFIPDDTGTPEVVDERQTSGKEVVVNFTTPIEPMKPFARNFFRRALDAKTPAYLVTKKTAFKYQEAYWNEFKTLFDEEYAEKFTRAGLPPLAHILTDAATIYLNNWRDGGFAFAAPNYEGDTLTDQLGAVHGSPALVTSILTGISSVDGRIIKEYEAIHGTGHTDWLDHQEGRRTSFNPLGLANALWGAMDHSATLYESPMADEQRQFTRISRQVVERVVQKGTVTRDIARMFGDDRPYVSTEEFIEAIARGIAETVPAALNL
ncbi:MAG: hypothetical protein H6908_00975 [Hyphomicrobiales bacterium]|nr:hypothetical protein [Rickettsiales bacterium]MCP5361204.1 hypothetical protein [Hyphomicrobiales bacterium]